MQAKASIRTENALNRRPGGRGHPDHPISGNPASFLNAVELP